jgi:tetratricopeptide (TPR) repeat protein
MLQQHDSVIESEPYFLKELQKSDYYMCYFHLARVAFEKQDRAAAIAYLETYLNRVPGDPQANNNLLLLYLETGQPDQARVVADRMKNFGLTVPPEAEKQMQSQKLPADSL